MSAHATRMLILSLLGGFLLFMAMCVRGDAAEPPTFDPKSDSSTAFYVKQRVGDVQLRGAHMCTSSKLAPGVFLTAKHCTNDLLPNSLSFVFRGKEVTGKYILGPQSLDSDDANKQDIAIVVADGDLEEMQTSELGCNIMYDIGTDVVTGGYPGPLGFTYGTGIITTMDQPTGLPPSYFGSDFWSDVPVFGGQSGSPVFERSTGQIIGVLVESWLGGQWAGMQAVGLHGLCK